MSTCVSIVFKDDSFLLIFKRRGLGRGGYNFPGGKLEQGESPVECARRETLEEVGIELNDAYLLGTVTFVHGVEEKMYVVVSRSFVGIPSESDEAFPFWAKELPQEGTWPDDVVWFDYVKRGQPFECVFRFSEDWSEYYGGYCEAK
jgi:8-oxo-dGTP diphosphatase